MSLLFPKKDSATANPRHSKATNRWGTSEDYIERSRTALGGFIGLDPMSEEVFQKTVQARQYYSEKDSCFNHQWISNSVFLNPAGGLVVRAWNYLMKEYLAGRVTRCIWVGFSVEQLNLLASEEYHPDDFSKLTCRKRISFVRHDGYEGAPGHANYVVGVGITKEVFESSFASLGRFSHGKMSISGAPAQSDAL